MREGTGKVRRSLFGFSPFWNAPMQFSSTLIKTFVSAQSVAVLTGAGVSAESGVPTFRDPDGLWQQFKPEELASMDAFLSNPERVQRWYAERRKLLDDVEPNDGHVALAELERLVTQQGGAFHLTTQNVDGLHIAAGSKNVGEIHGSLRRSYCVNCNRDATTEEMHAFQEGNPAHCPECGGLIRPDVVWFGEMLPEDVLRAGEDAARNADVYFSIGTSAEVYPAAGLPQLARDAGAFVIEINPRETALTPYASESIRETSATTLPELVKAMCRRFTP